MNKKPLLIVVSGPTGSGKTPLAIQIAKHTGASIVSADSRQVFHELRIGSAAPVAEELSAANHYFVGGRSITDPYNAGIFAKEALDLLTGKLFHENNIQIVCGGSGLYIRALIHGIDDLPQVDSGIRKFIHHIYQEEGLAALQAELRVSDPVYYEMVDIMNPQRIMRALEVIRYTGKPFSSFRKQAVEERPFDTLFFATDLPRKDLYHQINQRTLRMMEAGWLEETKNLSAHRNLNALQTVGYKELFEYLDGRSGLDETIALIQQNTRRFAKRQLTWLRSQPDVKWIHPAMSPGMLGIPGI